MYKYKDDIISDLKVASGMAIASESPFLSETVIGKRREIMREIETVYVKAQAFDDIFKTYTHLKEGCLQDGSNKENEYLVDFFFQVRDTFYDSSEIEDTD